MSNETPTYSIRLWAHCVSDPIDTVWRLVKILEDAGFPIQYKASKKRPIRHRQDVSALFAEREKRREGKVDYGVGISVHHLLTTPPRNIPSHLALQRVHKIQA